LVVPIARYAGGVQTQLMRREARDKASAMMQRIEHDTSLTNRYSMS